MYTKLFHSIITSTIWMEDDQTRLVWITMLALADKNGEVEGSIPGLARMAGVSVEACQIAIEKFLSPDTFSRTKDYEGRRIQEIEGGWFLLNHADHRRRASRIDQMEKNAERQRRHRAKVRNVTVTDSNSLITHLLPPRVQAEAEAEEEYIKKEKEEIRKVGHSNDERFSAALTRFIGSSSQNHHWNPAGTTVEAWQMELERHSLEDAIGMLDFSTSCGAKKPITNGDHKKKQSREFNNGTSKNKVRIGD